MWQIILSALTTAGFIATVFGAGFRWSDCGDTNIYCPTCSQFLYEELRFGRTGPEAQADGK
jgi:hypothetical protein